MNTEKAKNVLHIHDSKMNIVEDLYGMSEAAAEMYAADEHGDGYFVTAADEMTRRGALLRQMELNSIVIWCTVEGANLLSEKFDFMTNAFGQVMEQSSWRYSSGECAFWFFEDKILRAETDEEGRVVWQVADRLHEPNALMEAIHRSEWRHHHDAASAAFDYPKAAANAVQGTDWMVRVAAMYAAERAAERASKLL